MKLLKEGEITIEIFEEQSRGVYKNVLMVGLGSHLILESLPAILVFNCTVSTVLVDIFKELENLRDLYMFRHPFKEVLNTNHMKGEEAFLIFVFFVVFVVENIDTHLIDFCNSMKPESFLFTLCSSLFVTDFDDICDQSIKFHQMYLIRLTSRCLCNIGDTLFHFWRIFFILI